MNVEIYNRCVQNELRNIWDFNTFSGGVPADPHNLTSIPVFHFPMLATLGSHHGVHLAPCCYYAVNNDDTGVGRSLLYILSTLFVQLRCRPPDQLQECHLHSTNLGSLEGIVAAMETLPHVTSVLQAFHWPSEPHPVVVDIVCNHGYTWVKVVARKAQALHLIWAGKDECNILYCIARVWTRVLNLS